MASRRVALQLMARVVQRRWNDDRSDLAGSSLTCPGGETARYKGRWPKTCTGSVGRVTLERA